jgi:TonB-linked SusC/RagA family outer membrane protein
MKNTLSKAGAILLCLLLWGTFIRAQSIPIKGKITGPDGSPIIGASVAIKGQKTGTVTDVMGAFKLQAPGNATLVISFIGYLPREVPVNNRADIDVKLEEDQKKLDEVVVVGYGQQKKKDVTGAISSINSKTIMEVPVTNAQQALQGRTPGIDVLNNSNKPGDEPRVRVRGTRSLSAGNDPLYVVDGIPFAGNLNDINPQDIASMDVLKDASATAIYGSRGANGVVLVSTRKGKNSPRPQVTYNGMYGIVNTLGKTDMMDSQQYLAMKREANRAAGLYDDNNPDASDAKIFTPIELANIKRGVNTDWQSLMLDPGWQTRHSLGVSGGNESTKYAVTGGYFRDQGVLKLQSYERYNLHVSVDQMIGKRIQIGASTLATYSMRKGGNYNGMSASLKMLPIADPFDASGKLITYPTADNQQPNALLDYEDGNRVERLSHIRFFNSLYGEVTLLEGLKYRLNVGTDVGQNNYGLFQGKKNTDLLIGGGDATASKQGQFIWAYTVENLLTYSKTIKKHSLNLTALYSVQRQREDSSNASVRGIPVEWQEYYNLGQAANVTGIGSQLGTWTILSYMGRLNYGYDDRYLVTLTLRADGSSRFAPGHKWGYFPSVALGWNITSEDFMKGVSWIENLKLRGSYGRIGNTGIPPYATQGLLGRVPYSFGNKGVMGFSPILLRNPNLTWETTASTNIGLDFSFLKGRISGSIDAYKQKTTDLLLQRFLPFSNGFDYVLENTGVTQNKGLEIGLSTINVETKSGFSWTMDVNFYMNREKILALGEGKTQDVGNGWFVGKPTYVYYDYKKVGIWQDEAAAQVYKQHQGEIQLADINNDKKLDDKDRTILGTPQPKWSGGMTQRFSFKGLDLSVVAFARMGSTVKSDFYSTFNTLFGRYNNLDVDYWTPTNPTNAFPRPNANQERPNNYNTLSYFDGSFFKIRNITLGYSLPASMMKRWQMESLRFSLDVKQPLILAPYRQKYKGIDPEDVNVIGVDAPATWMVQFGINATF